MPAQIIATCVDDAACFYDTITGWAFGPVFRRTRAHNLATEAAECFSKWLRYRTETAESDPRAYSTPELEEHYAAWARDVGELGGCGLCHATSGVL